MDGFTAIVLFFLALTIGIFLLIGRYHPKSGPEVLDWKPTRSYEDEVRLELEDVDQMLEAQNARRRRTGRPELSEDQLRSEIHEEQRRRREQAERHDVRD